MHNHAPVNYTCPICVAVSGVENETSWIRQADVFYRDDLVLGLVSSKFVTGNEGHILVVPSQHFENLYDLPSEVGHRIMDIARVFAVQLRKIRHCDGVTIMQNNEPAGDQHAFHYHLHIFPRFIGDSFHNELAQARVSEPTERIAYADALRTNLKICKNL